MLQLIIWLGCFYLILKGVEIYLSSMPEERRSVRQAFAAGALLVAVLGAGTFVAFANEQVNPSPEIPGLTSDYKIEGSTSELEAGVEAAMDAAEKEAEAALEGNK